MSLQRGHRISVDIDLFTGELYGSIDFDEITHFLRKAFKYVDTSDYSRTGIGRAYFIGNSPEDCVKLDMFYTDTFVFDPILEDGIRLAAVEEIIAMKLDIIARNGRKKDFWDIHELMTDHTLGQMLGYHKTRYPYTHNEEEIYSGLLSFKHAEDDFEPLCLKGKYWQLIKLDIASFVRR